METKHIRLLNKAKPRLKSAVKRFSQAEGFLDEFKAAVPPEEKDPWANVPAEYHLLFDCRRNIRGARHPCHATVQVFPSSNGFVQFGTYLNCYCSTFANTTNSAIQKPAIPAR